MQRNADLGQILLNQRSHPSAILVARVGHQEVADAVAIEVGDNRGQRLLGNDVERAGPLGSIAAPFVGAGPDEVGDSAEVEGPERSTSGAVAAATERRSARASAARFRLVIDTVMTRSRRR